MTLKLTPKAESVFPFNLLVPLSEKDAIEKLLRLEQLGDLEPISYSPWADQKVAVHKPNGSVRMCADCSLCLNAALEDNRHPLSVAKTY